MKRGNQGERGGPFLVAALICEKVLIERDGVKSAIRIIDRLIKTATGPDAPAQMTPIGYEGTLLITLKPGTVRGEHTIRLTLLKPSGDKEPPFQRKVVFEGEDDLGMDILVNLRLKFESEGLYWIEIYFNDDLLTKVPLRVIYERRTEPAPSPGSRKPSPS